MEPVEILGGHPIYETTSLEEALDINKKWKAGGAIHGTKPRFRYLLNNPTKNSGLYGLQEIETDATRTKTGFRFKKVSTLATTVQKRRELLKKAGITDKELFNIYKKNFPEAPKKEIDQLVNFFREQDKLKNKEFQLQRLELERKYGKKFAIDHIEAVASGEKYTGVYTNKAVIEDSINAFKSDKKGSLAFRKFLKDKGIDTAENRILKSLYSNLDEKPGSMAWNKAMAKYFKPDSSTAKILYKANKALKPIKPVAKFIPYAGAAFTVLGAQSDIKAAEKDPTWQNKLQAKLSQADIWMEGSELATFGFTSPVTTPLQILSSVANIGIGMTEPGYKVTKEEQEKELRRQTEGGKYDFTTM